MNFIHFMQSFQTEEMTTFFKIITALGNEGFYVFIVPLFFWLWDKDKAIRLLFILLPSVLINYYLKEIFQTARPVGVSLIEQGGFSFPSGHAQGAATLWLMLALLVRQRWMTILAPIMIVLIALSRIYLGVHYPIDVIGGSLIGLSLVLVYDNYFFDNLKRFFATKSAQVQALCMTCFVLILILLYPTPLAITLLAVQWGFVMTLIFTAAGHYFAPKGIFKKLLLVIAGVAGVLIIRKGLKALLPPMMLTLCFRYALIGAWTAAVPLLYKRREKPF